MGKPKPTQANPCVVGDPETVKQKLLARIVVAENGCWEWQRCKGTRGYGYFKITGIDSSKAHRIAYAAWKGPVPGGMSIDHLCRNHSCINPDHLEPVTQKENYERGVSRATSHARSQSRTHCKHGHDMRVTGWYNPRGRQERRCSLCAALYMRAQRAKHRKPIPVFDTQGDTNV